MKKYLLLSTLLCFSCLVFSQQLSWENFNESRLTKQKRAMTILGTWAIGNIALGSIMTGRTSGETKYFHQMNAGWNVVNLVIAGAGYYGLTKLDAAGMDAFTSIQEQYKIQKLLLFNAGLDVGYMLGGAYLIERSKNQSDTTRSDRFSGWGKSIILQGGFLFAFDLTAYLVLASDNVQLKNLLSQVQLSGEGVGLLLHF